jgi:ABC-type glycerol-3-phosphate transport system substrate-binding protein
MVLSLLAVFALVLGACAQATPAPAEEEAAPVEQATAPPEEAAEPVEIVFMRFAEGHDIELEFVNEFNASHPDIHVTVDTVPAEDTYPKLALTSEAGTPPDVFMTYWTLGAATNGLALDLTPLIKAAGEEWFGGLSEWGWAFHDYAGSYYAVPWRVAPGVVFFNTNLLAKAGLKVPSGEWTWDEFVEYAKAMTNPAEEQYGFCIMGSADDPGTDYQYYPFLFQAGGVMINGEGLAGFNTPAGAEALQFMHDLIYVHKVTPPATTSATANACIDLLAADKVGMWTNASLWTGYIRNAYPNAQITIAPMPVGKTTGTLVGGTGFGIAKGSKHPEEAFEFIKFYVSDDIMRRWTAAIAFTPPNINILKDPAFTSDPEQAAVAYAMLNQKMYPLSHYPDNSNLESILRGYIQAVYLEEMTPEEAVAGAAAEWDSVLKGFVGDDWWDIWTR